MKNFKKWYASIDQKLNDQDKGLIERAFDAGRESVLKKKLETGFFVEEVIKSHVAKRGAGVTKVKIPDTLDNNFIRPYLTKGKIYSATPYCNDKGFSMIVDDTGDEIYIINELEDSGLKCGHLRSAGVWEAVYE